MSAYAPIFSCEFDLFLLRHHEPHRAFVDSLAALTSLVLIPCSVVLIILLQQIVSSSNIALILGLLFPSLNQFVGVHDVLYLFKIDCIRAFACASHNSREKASVSHFPKAKGAVLGGVRSKQVALGVEGETRYISRVPF